MSSNAGNIDRNYVMKRALVELKEMQSKLDGIERARTEPIAIIGIGCRFPGQAHTIEDFWHLLQTGTDATGEIPSDRWDIDAYYDPIPETPGKMYTRRGGFLAEVDRFDAHFFNISPREAITMDPQHRLLLEVAWEALEDAAVAPSSLVGSRTGVFVGITTNDYAHLCMKYGDLADIDAYVSTGNPLNFATGRLSYTLGLQGPCMTVDTACSSSLVAIHLACQSLRAGECQAALAGGVNLILSPEVNITLSKAHMLAADGRCKTFDADADGYGRSEGCGIVVLKRLSDALAAGDPILALIRGSAVNQNGPSSGITVPNGQAQEAVIRQALTNAGLEPAQVGYVEVHGTGTSLGDPIEVNALATVLCQGRPSDRPLTIGAVKTNVGHLESAAGVASLIKAALALHHEEIPPHLHLQKRNPYVSWDKLAVDIPTMSTPWPSGSEPRIAGVSSFGVSGTNAHLILEEAPKREAVPATAERSPYLLTLSAKSAEALQDLAQRWETHLQTHPSLSLADACLTANAGRSHFDHRLAIIGTSTAQMCDLLATAAQGKDVPGILRGKTRGTDRPKVAFLFTGQGSQYLNMGRQLYETQPIFRQTLERCDQLLRPYLEASLLSVLYPQAGESPLLDETAFTQPALFALEYSLATLWRSWGIEPTAVMGHSVGEYVAACVAGVFSLEDGLKLIAERARLMQALPQEGAMVAIVAGEALVAEAVAPYQQVVSVAAFNGPQNTVISGAREAVELIQQNLQASGIKTQRLRVSHAFHSPLMEPMLAPFAQVVKQVKFSTPQMWLVSNLTGQLVTGAEIAEAEYWCRHTREAVRYQAGMQTLQARGYKLFVEIGPGTTLLGMGKKCIAENGQEWLPSLRKGRSDWQQLQESLAGLYVHGVAVDWASYAQDSGQRQGQLPTYTWQRERYWIEETEPRRDGTLRPSARPSEHQTALHPLLGQRLSSPLKQIQFESQLSIDRVPLIKEHSIYGKFVVPGVVYLEMAIAGVEEALGIDMQTLEDLSLLQPIVLNEGDEQTVQLVLTPNEQEQGQPPREIPFQIFSLATSADHKDETWRLHVTGRLCSEQADTLPPVQELVSLETIRERCQEEVSGTKFYQSIWNPQFQLGPSFQCVETLWRRDGEVLGQLRFSNIPEPEAQSAQVRPEMLVLDASVQLLIAALPEDKDMITGTTQDVYVGTGQEFSRVYKSLSTIEASPTATLWCQALLRPGDNYKEEICGDLLLCDESGQIVAEVKGVHLKRLGGETLQRLARTSMAARQREKGSLSSRLLTAEPEKRLHMLETYLAEEVSKVLRLPLSRLDPEQSLASLVDSLMVMEMKNQIESDLETTIPVALFFEGDSISQLARLLLAHLTAEADALSQNLENIDSNTLAQMLAELEQLSDEEAEQNLATNMHSVGKE